MTVFADSSAVVTLYADEPGRQLLSRRAIVVISALARVEVPAAIWRKQRLGELTAQSARVLVDEFEDDYFGTGKAPRFATVAVTVGVLDDAARLCAAHGLRAYDAVQLAAAVAARTADPECEEFAAYDETLRRAASVEGFDVIPGPESLS